jgi:HK97 family phage prohead protease
MPYSLTQEHPDCAGWAVVKDEDNTLMGCHQTEADAQAQLTAINIAESEQRSIPLTDKMRASAQKGLGYWADGLAGDGLQESTVEEARAIARGEIDEDKVTRLGAWIARHRVDWEGIPQNSDQTDERFPGPGAVAAYLWAVDPTDPEDADRVIAWCERYAASEEAEPEDEGEDEVEEETSGERKETKMGEIERRTITADSLEYREDGRTFTGYAALYDSPSAGLGFTEVIKPGAFNRTLSRAKRGEANIVALYGHDELSFLGSTTSGALKLESDTRGLRVELKLPETQLGNDLAALFRAGEAPAMGMSFGFSVPSKNCERWTADGTTRELTELRLHEVSLLSGGQTPAYPGTIGLGSVRALAQRLGVEPEIARDAIDALLSGALDEARTAILIRAIGGEPEAPAAEPAPDAIIEEAQTADEAPSQAEPAVPTSTLVALGEVRFRAKQ